MAAKAAFFIAIATAAFGAAPAAAQTLDSQIEFYTEGDCSNLGVFIPGLPFITTDDVGPNLLLVCQDLTGVPPGSTSPASGGGAAALQSSSNSVSQLDAIARRLKAAEDELDDEQTLLKEDSAAGIGSWNADLDPYGVFLTVDVDSRDRDETKFESGHDALDWGITAGADRRFGDSMFAGLAVQFSHTEGDFDSGGDFETDSYRVVAYGAYRLGDILSADLTVGYARKHFEVDRLTKGTFNENINLNGINSSENDSDNVSIRFALGKDVQLGRYILGARAGLNYEYSDIEGYTEKGSTGLELVFKGRDTTSVQSLLSVHGSTAISTPLGVLIPQLGVEYVHEFEADQEHVTVRFVEDTRPDPLDFKFQTEKPDRNYANLRLSVSWQLPYGFNPYAQFRTILGHEYYESYGGAIGLRYDL